MCLSKLSKRESTIRVYEDNNGDNDDSRAEVLIDASSALGHRDSFSLLSLFAWIMRNDGIFNSNIYIV